MDFSVRSWEGSDEHDDSDQGGHDEDNENNVDDNDHEHIAIKCSQEERHVCGEPHFLCRIFAFW